MITSEKSHQKYDFLKNIYVITFCKFIPNNITISFNF